MQAAVPEAWDECLPERPPLRRWALRAVGAVSVGGGACVTGACGALPQAFAWTRGGQGTQAAAAPPGSATGPQHALGADVLLRNGVSPPAAMQYAENGADCARLPRIPCHGASGGGVGGGGGVNCSLGAIMEWMPKPLHDECITAGRMRAGRAAIGAAGVAWSLYLSIAGKLIPRTCLSIADGRLACPRVHPFTTAPHCLSHACRR